MQIYKDTSLRVEREQDIGCYENEYFTTEVYLNKELLLMTFHTVSFHFYFLSGSQWLTNFILWIRFCLHRPTPKSTLEMAEHVTSASSLWWNRRFTQSTDSVVFRYWFTIIVGFESKVGPYWRNCLLFCNDLDGWTSTGSHNTCLTTSLQLSFITRFDTINIVNHTWLSNPVNTWQYHDGIIIVIMKYWWWNQVNIT